MSTLIKVSLGMLAAIVGAKLYLGRKSLKFSKADQPAVAPVAAQDAQET